MGKYLKKAQGASGAGALVAIIAGFIIVYMLMIPPDLREELLNDENTYNGVRTSEGSYVKYDNTVFTDSPGRIDYMKQKEYEHNIPAINLFSSINAQEIIVAQDTYVKNSIFDRVDKKLFFNINNPEDLDNVYMGFSLSSNRNNIGVLTIKLNGNEVYSKNPNGLNSNPISISSQMLKAENEVVISVSSVGWEFWRTNEYEVKKLQVYFDEKDASKQSAISTFVISDTEKYNLDQGKFEFYPDCLTDEVGTLTLTMNGFKIFSGLPDCGQLNKIDVLPAYFDSGSNVVEFVSTEGRYYISNIVIKTEMKGMTYPVYYFDLAEELFIITDSNKDETEECGDIDGYCPSNCDVDKDKDCCLEESSNYWCDLKPVNEDDRCRSVLDANICLLCKSGYEDSSGDPPETCEGMCGDDTDNECPSVCSKYYDEDCCFEESEENYWCDDVPQWGTSYTCRNSISKDDCDDCVSNYQTESGSYSCPGTTTEPDGTSQIKSYYNVYLTVKFADGESRKAAKFLINGYQFYVDTTKDEYRRLINAYVEDGSNAIKIEPDTTLDIRSLDVEVKNR